MGLSFGMMEAARVGSRNLRVIPMAIAALVLFGSEVVQVQATKTFSETDCKNKKLKATGNYVKCLTRGIIGGNENDVASCDDDFFKAFDFADNRFSCNTPVEGAVAFGARIKQQVEENAASVMGDGGASNVISSKDDGTAIVQVAWETSTAFDLSTILTDLSDQNVTKSTTIVIQAWGGRGGTGTSGNGGSGGAGGYAQTVTTIGDYEKKFGTTMIYYYLGYYGTHSSKTGGDGGTASVVTPIDLTDTTPEVDRQLVLLAAGGGGGGGGQVSTFDPVVGGSGGNGAVAIGNEDGIVIFGGRKGNEASCNTGEKGGKPGSNEGTGGAAGGSGNPTAGDDYFAPLGGVGGSHSDPQIGFVNKKSGIFVITGGGQGGQPGSNAGGGGGGGGYGAGGGGSEGLQPGCSGGGGGGSSLAMQATRTCAVAPTGRPSNPNQELGYVQFIVDLGGCES